jgi:DNA-binding PadR family transcriptional regulator
MSVRHALLALLNEGPKYGLQLQQEFEASTSEVWPLNIGQVYSTLQRLERDGLIVQVENGSPPSQKGFQSTEIGEKEIFEWLQTPPAAEPPPRDELVIKILVALQVPGIDVPEILQIHRRYMVETMQAYTRLKATVAEDDVGLLLIVDAQLFRLEGVVRWLDIADARIRQQTSNHKSLPRREVDP